MRNVEDIIKKCKYVYTQTKRVYNERYELSDGDNKSDHWDRLANIILELDVDVHYYISTAFERVINPHEMKLFVLTDPKTIALVKAKQREDKLKPEKALEMMEQLYRMRVKKGFAKPKILLDTSLYFNSAFRYCKALDEGLIEVAYVCEDAAIDFLRENKSYIELLKDKLPEGVLCRL